MQYSSIYVYGILDGRTRKIISSKGIGGRGDKVYGIPFKDVTAVISNTPFEEYDPSEENTIAHENVIQEILKHDLTIAPMRFCTVLRTKDDLMKLMFSAYMPFKRNIIKVRDRLEFSVKVFLEIEKLRKEVKNDGELIKKSRDIAARLHDKLKGLADELVLDEQITEDMIMNASFLVHKENINTFYREIENFDKKFEDKLKIRISGPTAPYNFVDMPTR